MKPEKINIIFSILFLIWFLPILFIVQSKKLFEFADYTITINLFCGIIIFTAFFNVLAFFYKKCWFYAVGTVGFLLFFLFHLINIIVFITVLMGYNGREYTSDTMIFFVFSNINFPLSFFGLFSTLFCFQQKYKENIEEESIYGISKSKTTLLKFCIKDYLKLILFYNVAILFTTFVFCAFLHKCRTILGETHFQLIDLGIFIPLFTPFFNFFAIRFWKKILCIVIISIWAIFSVVVVAFFGYQIYNYFQHSHLNWNIVIVFCSVFATYFINLFVFISTTLYIYHSNKREETESEATTASSRIEIEIAKEATKNTEPKIIFNINIVCCNYGYSNQ